MKTNLALFAASAASSSDGKLFIASAEMRDSSGPRGQAEGNYKMNIKIYNPGCPYSAIELAKPT